ncbi:unnamed protein product [Bursaphelenchus xylophilus]|uniref:(pine wood nematode) hypothetical protein n=1 Tax=Bursaphelenchus xylophilus TaxID=6326 RepID=A0A1I7RYT4_BURXY|nr:unnamed protein product [Bursaphelenchus xylophilus]CAG9092262.1 unnamed protein product [Bursaphelenchus xylophilus]
MAASNIEKIKAAALGAILIVAIALLALSIVTLVNVNSHNDKDHSDKDDGNNNASTPPPNNDKSTTTKPDDTNDDMHIPSPNIVDSVSQPDLYEAYNDFATDLKTLVNFTYDPCNNFFEYVCANSGADMSFDIAQRSSNKNFLKGLKRGNSNKYAVKAREAFDFCVKAQNDKKLIHQDGAVITELLKFAENELEIQFPGWEGTTFEKPNPQVLARIIGGITGKFGLKTFVDIDVDTNWPEPTPRPRHHQPAYRLFFDQINTYYPETFYSKIWDQVKPKYVEKIKNLVNQAAALYGKTVKNETLDKDIDEVVEFEKHLALEINTDKNTRRNFSRSYNLNVLGESKSYYIDLAEFTKAATEEATPTEVQKILRNPNYVAINMEPEVFEKMTTYYKDTVNPRALFNYVYYRLFLEHEKYFPELPKTTFVEELLAKTSGFHLGTERDVSRRSPIPYQRAFDKDDDGKIEEVCVKQVLKWMPEATSRIFIDAVYTDQKGKENMKKEVTQLVSNVLAGFQAQLDQLNWMSTETKQSAYNKIKYLTRNIAYPEWIDDDPKLNEYYESLRFEINDGTKYHDLDVAFRKFLQTKQWSDLLRKTADRQHFGRSAVIVNAWYQPELNSITMPFGILQRPFYDPKYPASLNYGGIGVVAGHELTHGFDDHGVQWDGTGRLSTWMDPESRSKFDKMAQCVIDEYDGFRPLENLHVDGKATQGENIADNGGIRAAYNAFQAHLEMNGQDPRLPGDFHAFSHEQLFFIAFARTWCEATPKDDALQRQLLVDPHSPSKYRVFGTVQNFPAFRSAFNCPVGARYAPKDHCKVWASAVKPVRGVPVPPKIEPELKIDPPAPNNTEQFKFIAKGLAENLNLDNAACDDFHNYACGGQSAFNPLETSRKSVEDSVLAVLYDPRVEAPLRFSRRFFISCKDTKPENGTLFKTVFDEFQTIIGTEFPPLNNSSKGVHLSPETLAKALFYLSTSHDINVLYNIDVAPNTGRFGGSYKLRLSAPDTVFKNVVYKGKHSAAEYSKKLAENLFSSKLLVVYPELVNTKDTVISEIEKALNIETYVSRSFKQNNGRRSETQKERTLTTLFQQPYGRQFGFQEYIKNIRSTLVDDSNKFNDNIRIIVENEGAWAQDQELLAEIFADDGKRRELVTHLYVRLLLKYQHTIPGSNLDLPPGIADALSSTPYPPIQEDADRICADIFHQTLPDIYAFAAFKKIYEKPARLEKAQKKVGQIVESVALSFEGLFSGLSWMPVTTRKNLVRKVKGVARNIGVGKSASSERELQALYAKFTTEPKNIIEWSKELAKYRRKKRFGRLQFRSRDRTLFNSIYNREVVSEISADRELNAINIPLEYMQAPYFDDNNPAVWTFGTLGLAVARAFGHLFDQKGLEFNEDGELFKLTDSASENRIQKDFEDLLTAFSNEKVVVKALENSLIADNTAILLAKRSLEKWIDNHGSSGALPDEYLTQFTNPQLFYYIASQGFCKKREENEYQFNNAWYLRKILGNSKEFGGSFSCSQTPEKTFSLWESPEEGIVGVPKLPKQAPNLNIPEREQRRNPIYEECARQIADSIDLTQNPCENFYEYACGSFTETDIFSRAVDDIRRKIEGVVLRPIQNDDGKAVQLQKLYVQKCIESYNSTERQQDTTIVYGLVSDFRFYSKLPFPLADEETEFEWPSAPQLGKAIGYLNGRHGNEVLLKLAEAPNFLHTDKGWTFTVGPGRPILENYIKKNEREDGVNLVIERLTSYLEFPPNSTTDPEAIRDAANAIYDLEKNIYDALKTLPPPNGDQTDLRKGVEEVKLRDLKSDLIDFKSVIEGVLVDHQALVSRYTDKRLGLLKETNQGLETLLTTLAGLKARIPAKDILNYIYFAAINTDGGAYIPKSNAAPLQMMSASINPTAAFFTSYSRPEIPLDPKKVEAANGIYDGLCVTLSRIEFPEVNNYWIKTMLGVDFKDYYKTVQEDGATLIDSVLLGYESLLAQADWVTSESLKGAKSKFSQVAKVVGVPKVSESQEELDKRYARLNLYAFQSYDSIKFAVNQFRRSLRLDALSDTYVHREALSNFFTSAIPAYQVTSNSLDLPLGALRPPVHDHFWPDPVNYGALGSLVGQGVSTALGTMGRQLDGVGSLKSWMDQKTIEGYNKLRACIQNQYGDFCEMRNGNSECMDTSNHSTETYIGDAGGLQAAYRAYRNAVGVKGPKLGLPGDIIGQFTSDQLFFLSFAKTFCSADRPLDKKYRVVGALQNFPAFKDAFNCKTGAKYAPTEHCYVWTSEVKPSLAVPTTTTTVPPLNIPAAQEAPNDDSNYAEVSQLLLQSLDVESSPCNDFYGYVCKNIVGNDETEEQLATRAAAETVRRTLRDGKIEIPRKEIITQYYESCLALRNGERANVKASLDGLFAKFKEETGADFPIFSDDPQLDEKFVEKSIAVLSTQHHLPSLIHFKIEPNLETTEFAYPSHLLQLDDDVLIFPREWYAAESASLLKRHITGQIVDVLRKYVEVGEKDPIEYEAEAERIYHLEYVLASFIQKDTSRFNLKQRQHIVNVTTLSQTYANIDWIVLLDKLLESAPSAVRSKFLQVEKKEGEADRTVLNKEYKLSVSNPNGLRRILNVWNEEGVDVSKDELANYFYFRILWNNRDVLNGRGSAELSSSLKGSELVSLTCALDTRTVGPLHTKAYFESSNVVFDDIHEKISQVANNIINSFAVHIRQAGWISEASKTSAIDKIKNVKIQAIGDLESLQDDALKSYYSEFNETAQSPLFVLKKIAFNQFKAGKTFEKLLKDSVRSEFAGTGTEARPIYDRFTNTLTIPAASVVSPFFEPKYPNFVNYGSVGVRIAHVLAHSLDELGIQLDASGHYSDWFAEKTTEFRRIKDCLEKQYEKFCPLEHTNYPDKCLGSHQLIDENIADNVAVHVAYTAYELAKDNKGADPRFIHLLLGQFSPDQTFFLGYARQYCEGRKADSLVLGDLSVGKIPAEFRVRGALQNYRAFKSAFNCPARSNYTSEKPCEVFTGAGAVQVKSSSLNIRDKKQIDRTYPEPQWEAFKTAAEFFNYSMDLTADPCNDFFKYACGNYKKPKSFTVLREKNFHNQAKAIKNINVENQSSTALKKLRQYYDQCVVAYQDFPGKIENGTQALRALQALRTAFGGDSVKPTMFYKTADKSQTSKLEQAIAYLQVHEGVQTLVTETIEVDGEHGAARPGTKPKMLYLDEPTLVMSKGYYQGQTWTAERVKYEERLLRVLKNFLVVYKNTDSTADADETRLKEYITKFAELEEKLAKAPYATDETTRRTYTCEKRKLSDAATQFPSFKTSDYVKELIRLSKTSPLQVNDDYEIAFKWTTTFKKLWEDVGSNSLADQDTLINYLYMRLLLANDAWIPSEPKKATEDVEQTCGQKTQFQMMYANGRAFADYMFPTAEKKKFAWEQLKKMVDAIRYQFQGMLDELRWIDSSSREFLNGKVRELQINLLYPEFSLKNDELDKYYASFEVGSDYFESTKRLTLDLKHHEYNYLTEEGKNYRDDFIQWPGTVNAWYEPFYNSLTLPEGIVQPPFYHAYFPTSVNYGGLGVVTGHELSHAFDDEGIQWDGIGRRNLTGLSENVRRNFTDMAQCIVDQYGSFQPLDPAKYTPSRLNGENTQGENIADNGGIHAAYRAYKNHINLNGQEPQLPHPILSQLTHDQLFFLGFAQVWCQADAKPEELHKQILTDPHSPSIYRVMGTVQNYPAFREAFNCPANAQYTPNKHCSVWVPDGDLV